MYPLARLLEMAMENPKTVEKRRGCHGCHGCHGCRLWALCAWHPSQDHPEGTVLWRTWADNFSWADWWIDDSWAWNGQMGIEWWFGYLISFHRCNGHWMVIWWGFDGKFIGISMGFLYAKTSRFMVCTSTSYGSYGSMIDIAGAYKSSTESNVVIQTVVFMKDLFGAGPWATPPSFPGSHPQEWYTQIPPQRHS